MLWSIVYTEFFIVVCDDEECVDGRSLCRLIDGGFVVDVRWFDWPGAGLGQHWQNDAAMSFDLS